MTIDSTLANGAHQVDLDHWTHSTVFGDGSSHVAQAGNTTLLPGGAVLDGQYALYGNGGITVLTQSINFTESVRPVLSWSLATAPGQSGSYAIVFDDRLIAQGHTTEGWERLHSILLIIQNTMRVLEF